MLQDVLGSMWRACRAWPCNSHGCVTLLHGDIPLPAGISWGMMGALCPRHHGPALGRAAPTLGQAQEGVSGWGVRFGVCISAVNIVQMAQGPVMAVGDTGVGASLAPAVPSNALGGGGAVVLPRGCLREVALGQVVVLLEEDPWEDPHPMAIVWACCRAGCVLGPA